jgi:hypothetical protein
MQSNGQNRKSARTRQEQVEPNNDAERGPARGFSGGLETNRPQTTAPAYSQRLWLVLLLLIALGLWALIWGVGAFLSLSFILAARIRKP